MYEEYLRALLEPLGVYRFEEGGIQTAELEALGRGLDAVASQLELTEVEALAATAKD